MIALIFSLHLQNMSTFESELENLLGEFHIKMKGEMGKTFPNYERRREFANVYNHVLVISRQPFVILYSL